MEGKSLLDWYSQAGESQELPFVSISFNNKTFVGQLNVSNTFKLCLCPDVSLNIDALYITPGMIQGLFEMSRVRNISEGLRWSSNDDSALSLSLVWQIVNRKQSHTLTHSKQ